MFAQEVFDIPAQFMMSKRSVVSLSLIAVESTGKKLAS